MSFQIFKERHRPSPSPERQFDRLAEEETRPQRYGEARYISRTRDEFEALHLGDEQFEAFPAGPALQPDLENLDRYTQPQNSSESFFHSRHFQNPNPLSRREIDDETSVGWNGPPDDGDYLSFSYDDDYSTADDDPEERIRNPAEYFEKLERLEENLINHSSLGIYEYNRPIHAFELCIEFPRSSILTSIVSQSDEDILDLCQTAPREFRDYAKLVIHLLRCRNILFATYKNCCKLHEEGFGNRINFLRVRERRKGVAELDSYAHSSIKRIATEFDHAILRFLYQTPLSKGIVDDRLAIDALHSINETCNTCLKNLGLFQQEMVEQPYHLRWYCVAQALDLATLSYVGAHNQNFGRYLPHALSSFDIPGPFAGLPVQFTLRPRRLQCLDEFFNNGPLWVFHPRAMSKFHDVRMYLSANMEDFSQIWGPVWAMSNQSSFDSIQRFDVGGGSISPWPLPRDFGDLELPGEVFCHWQPYKDVKRSSGFEKGISIRDTLLIGARVQLEWNPGCETTVGAVESRLIDSHSLHDLRTTESSFYVDSTTTALALSTYGINIGIQKQFKRRDGVKLKSVLLDRWKHEQNGIRMIKDLEKGYGLEISFCSLNARRTTLFDLLSTRAMQVYINELDCADSRCRENLIDILERGQVNDILALYRKSTCEWRKEIRDLIFYSLCVLAECSVSEKDLDLSIPWMTRREIQSVTLKRTEISWTGFLQDSRDNSVFGLLVNKCLAFDYKGGRRCGRETGKPVLQTSIRINKRMQENWMTLKRWPSGSYQWIISAVFKRCRFPLGSQGSLTALAVLDGRAHGALLVDWASEASTKRFFKTLLRWHGGAHHQEYIGAKSNPKDCPLHIFIEAKEDIPGNPAKTRRYRRNGR
ncbi:hypothetical protein N431DRAFT_101839 [Stipitochalara longipes BDJ]|nr:hypothetical protein N431DRAFT_101839 [Stipitochalara longipes BDJ]